MFPEFLGKMDALIALKNQETCGMSRIFWEVSHQIMAAQTLSRASCFPHIAPGFD